MLKISSIGAAMLALAWLLACGDSTSMEEDTVEWGYSGESSPDKWGALSEEYSECSEGKQQSPLDIAGYSSVDGPALSFEYGDDGTHIENTGLFVKVHYEGNSRMRVGASEYTLDQAHAHNPSEHTIEGEHFPLEMHLVHEREGGGLAVLGVLYRLGAANTAIQAMIDGAPRSDGSGVMEPAYGRSGFLAGEDRLLRLLRVVDHTAVLRRCGMEGAFGDSGGIGGAGRAARCAHWRRSEQPSGAAVRRSHDNGFRIGLCSARGKLDGGANGALRKWRKNQAHRRVTPATPRL